MEYLEELQAEANIMTKAKRCTSCKGEGVIPHTLGASISEEEALRLGWVEDCYDCGGKGEVE